MGRRVILTAGLAACVHIGMSQTVTVDPSTVPGVELSGPLSAEYSTYVDQILAPPRSPALNGWLPFGIVLKNGTSQNVIGFAVHWNVNLPNGSAGALFARLGVAQK